MAISENFKYAFYAILLYLPTLAYVRVEFFLIAIGAILFFERKALLSEAIAFKKNPFARNYLTSFWLIALPIFNLTWEQNLQWYRYFVFE
jgi:hypothetical protein